MAQKIETVEVPLGERSYQVRIGRGLLARCGEEIQPFLRRPRLAIVTEKNVADLHLPALLEGLRKAGLQCTVLTVDAGEQSKNWDNLENVVEWFVEEEIARDDVVVAFGGGVVGDLVGFAAAILRRGVGYIQVPTTLLAQVDSSVGGKTAINSRLGKNLIGAFHQPLLVLADTDVLNTMPRRDLLAGYGEVAKYGLLGDENFFYWLEENADAMLGGNAEALAFAVKRSCEMKAALVAADETEQGDRALLNLGHTFGHALEASTGYSERLLHGEGVSMGCLLAFELSARLGLCPQETPGRVAAHYQSLGLRHRLDQIDGPVGGAKELLGLMAQDKKVRDGRQAFILARDIGDAFVARDVDLGAVESVLDEALNSRDARP